MGPLWLCAVCYRMEAVSEDYTRESTYRTFTNANGCELREYCVNECERAHTHQANSVTEV